MNGYAGKILRINLSTGVVASIATADYAAWGGGHGIGSAIFFDLTKGKNLEAIDGFNEANVVTIMTSPLTGTMALGASARTEMQGIGVQSYPTGWFTRSNFGGRFGAMLKYAGWDGVVIEGKAASPVWIDIRDDDVQIRQCAGLSLWGKDTWETQQAIWDYVKDSGTYGNWIEPTSGSDRRTTQRPAVLAIGPAGENLARMACVIHDAGNASGQGGFGGVWGAKNLKALSVIGTGDIHVADPTAVFAARQLALKNFTFPLENFDQSKFMWATMPSNLRSFPIPLLFWQRPSQSRPQACMGCQAGCRARYADAAGNDSSCKETGFYRFYSARYISAELLASTLRSRAEKGKKTGLMEKVYDGLIPGAQKLSADLAQKYGINAGELEKGLPYLRSLHKMGAQINGKKIGSYLPFNRLGEAEFVEKLLHMIAYRESIGDDMAEGFARAAERWGRLDDMKTGVLNNCHWGLPMHYDPRVSLEWGYGTMLGDRDINEHGMCPFYMVPFISKMMAGEEPMPSEDFVKLFSDRMEPFTDDPLMLDYSTPNMYSEHIAKMVAWHRYYGRFWIQSALYCDMQYPDFFNWAAKGYKGITADADCGEQAFFNAVTGKSMTFADGIQLGKKIWNLDHAIWTLQGRHRDDVKFSDYIYDEAAPKAQSFNMPVTENGQWTYAKVGGRTIDRAGFEQFKSNYYQLEGWDPATGWPTRSSLEALGLKPVADELAAGQKLGKESA